MDKPSVYKLHFGSRYVIWKGKTLLGSVEQNFKDIWKLVWRPGTAPNPVFTSVADYIRSARVTVGRVEVILQTDNLQQLIDCERDLLAAGTGDEACLNANTEPHIPKWISEVLSNQGDKPAAVIQPPAAQNKPSKASLVQKVVETPIVQVKPPVDAPKIDQDKLNRLKAAFGKLPVNK